MFSLEQGRNSWWIVWDTVSTFYQNVYLEQAKGLEGPATHTHQILLRVTLSPRGDPTTV